MTSAPSGRPQYRALLLSLLISVALPAWPQEFIDIAGIAARSASLQCLDYRVIGVCVWLDCDLSGCRLVPTPKIRHYSPDVVVTAYHETGETPWIEMQPLIGALTAGLEGGVSADAVAQQHTNLRFKNVDAIGHPVAGLLDALFGPLGISCRTAAQPFIPYFVSTLDTVAWRYGIPEAFFPQALVPGVREIGGVLGPLGTWGSLYPRSGFLVQAHDYKAAAVTAQRAANVITQRNQPHVYRSIVADPSVGYWPPGEAIEGDPDTARWQRLLPTPESDCHIFSEINDLNLGLADPYAERLSEHGDYVWNLWRPYACCTRAGAILLFSIDF
jgi:integrating conjugative element protein (TIGR03756 family)